MERKNSFYRSLMARLVTAVAMATTVTSLELSMPADQSLMGSWRAQAVPATPIGDSSNVLAEYQKISREAERATEGVHLAQDKLDADKREIARQSKIIRDAKTRENALQKHFVVLNKKMNTMVTGSYEGARLSQMFSVLVSDSPQQTIDQMSVMSFLSQNLSHQLDDYHSTKQQLAQTKEVASQALANANKARQAAERQTWDLRVKQTNLVLKAARVRAVYQTLTGAELSALAGPSFNFDPSSIPRGVDRTSIAVQAALSRIGDPYVWGGTNPGGFDCSGLMQWAYRQAGVAIPRSSEAQEAGGTLVSRNNLRPGDLIIIYSDASHVAMYIGDGFVIHASTFGVPVKIVPIDQAGPYNQARRY